MRLTRGAGGIQSEEFSSCEESATTALCSPRSFFTQAKGWPTPNASQRSLVKTPWLGYGMFRQICLSVSSSIAVHIISSSERRSVWSIESFRAHSNRAYSRQSPDRSDTPCCALVIERSFDGLRGRSRGISRGPRGCTIEEEIPSVRRVRLRTLIA